MTTAKKLLAWGGCLGLLIVLTKGDLAHADIICPGNVPCSEIGNCSDLPACDDSNQPCCFSSSISLAPAMGSTGTNELTGYGVNWQDGRVDSARGSAHSLTASLASNSDGVNALLLESDVVEWVFSENAERGSDSVGICIASNIGQQATAESACWSVTTCEDARGIEGVMYILDSRAVSDGNVLCGNDIVAAIAELFAAVSLPDSLDDAEEAVQSSFETYRGYRNADTISGPINHQAATLLNWAKKDTFQ